MKWSDNKVIMTLVSAKKSANIYVTIITMMVALLAVTAMLTFTINDKVNTVQYSRRISNRYTAESSIDLACYLIKNKLNNKDVRFRYLYSEASNYYYLDEQLDDYIFDEIGEAAEGVDEVLLEDVGNNITSYLYSNGFAEFGKGCDTKVYLLTDSLDKSYYKTVNLCQGYLFRGSSHTSDSNEYNTDSKLNDLSFLIKVNYGGGVVRATIDMSNVHIKRNDFRELPSGIESGVIAGIVDTSACEVNIVNYQNYLVNEDVD